MFFIILLFLSTGSHDSCNSQLLELILLYFSQNYMSTIHEICAADYEKFKKKLNGEQKKPSKFFSSSSINEVSDFDVCPTAKMIQREAEDAEMKATEAYWERMHKRKEERQRGMTTDSITPTKPLWQLVNDSHRRHISASILRVVFSYLNYKDLLLIAPVSRLWSASSENDLLWKNICYFYGITEPAAYSWKVSLKSFISRTSVKSSETLTDELAVIKKSLFAELTNAAVHSEEEEIGVHQRKFKERLAVLQNDAIDQKVDNLLSYVNNCSEVDKKKEVIAGVCDISEFSDHLSGIEANKCQHQNTATELRNSHREIFILLNAAKRRQLLSQFEATIASETGNPQAGSFSMLEHNSIINPTSDSSKKWIEFRNEFPLNIYYDIFDSITILTPSASSLSVAVETGVVDIINEKLKCSVLNCV